jgi:hypothetical protein
MRDISSDDAQHARENHGEALIPSSEFFGCFVVSDLTVVCLGPLLETSPSARIVHFPDRLLFDREVINCFTAALQRLVCYNTSWIAPRGKKRASTAAPYLQKTTISDGVERESHNDTKEKSINSHPGMPTKSPGPEKS